MSARYIYSRGYNFNRSTPLLRRVHGFVLNKPARIRRWLAGHGIAAEFERPTRFDEKELSAIHDTSLLEGLRSSAYIARAAELPPLAYTPAFVSRHLLVQPQLLACDGTRRALEYAAQGDWVFNLSGGFHHARPDLAHGFCLVNDVAWAVHCLNAGGQTPPILVLDFDLHQGDGNSAAFSGRDDVFTASLHQENTFPIPKLESDLDRGLVGGAVNDEVYLREVDEMLAAIRSRFEPEVVIYVAGTDPFQGDAIGDFAVSLEGLIERDRRVARFTRGYGAGLVALPAGGYAPTSPEISARGFAAMREELVA